MNAAEDLSTTALRLADKPLVVTYRNWKGETRERRLIPGRAWFGSTEHHPEPQWLLEAFDLETLQTRSFAFAGFVWPKAEPATPERVWPCDGCGEPGTRECMAPDCGRLICDRCGHFYSADGASSHHRKVI